uniref:leucine-rich repeat domain-containing protein n=1 Tax=Alistipes putredinis TaxID=28117 RepID=UPI003FD82540
MSIGNYAFYDCLDLGGYLNLPENLQSIGEYAFAGRSTASNKLSGDLIIPDSVFFIGKYAFRGCNFFNGILSLSTRLTEIPEHAFSQCSRLHGNILVGDNVKII